MFVRRYIDRFDDNQATPPLKTSLGNGTIVESGTSIVLTAPAAADCRWDAGLAVAPVAYLEDASVFPEGALNSREYGNIGLIGWEVRITHAAFTPVDDVPRGGLTLWWGYANAYQLAYDFSSEYVVFERMVGDVKTAIADSGGNTGSPNTTPKRLKLLFNPRTKTMRAYGQDINAGQIAAFHSANDGASYAFLGKENVALDEAHFGAGIFLKRSVASPTSSATMTFDYLEYGELYVTKEDLETAVFEEHLELPSAGGAPKYTSSPARGMGAYLPGPPSQPTDQPIGPLEQASFEDQHPDFPTSGGPAQHQAPAMLSGYTKTTLVPHNAAVPHPEQFGTGQELPGSPTLPPGADDRAREVGALEDTLTFPKAVGPTHHGAGHTVGSIMSGDGPNQPDGGALRFRQASWEDRMFVQLGGPPMDYPVSVLDGDGNVFIEGYQTYFLMLYDPSTDDFGATRAPGDGFYGADRSGVCYYDGTACGFGDFGTVSNGVRYTAWSASDAEPMGYGQAPSWGISIPTDGTVRMLTAGATNEGVNVASNLRWYVEGDFDIEVEWLDYVMAGGTDGGPYFEVHIDNGEYAYVRRRTPGSNRIDSGVKLNGSWFDYAQVPTSQVAGKFRITRTGYTVKRYYDIGGGWVQIGTDQSFGNERVYVRLGFWGSGTLTSGDIKFRNLTVNLGTISNKVGWTAEAFGDHRGNRDDFPDTAIIASTEASVDIIDADNHKLWMRFQTDENNILDLLGASTRPRRVVMKNGVLLIALANDANTEGGLIRADFNLDTVNIHQTDASSITGAHYKCTKSGDTSGIRSGPGALRGRNDAKDWTGDFATWKQHANATRAGDLHFSGGYEFRAAANEGGLALFKWRRWYLFSAVAGESIEIPLWAHDNSGNRMYWCHFRSTGELMYMDDTNIYSVFSGTYEPRLAGGFGGIFGADQTKALPGTRTYDVQKMMVPYSTSTFFLPADEGVYQINWPIGSFIHQFGHVGSGAAYELIPTGAVVKDVTVGLDGGTPLLVLVLYFKDTGTDRLMAVNLIGNTVHAYTPLLTGNMQFAESVA